MSSVATEHKLQQAVSLQGVDPETCMIVFKNHWAQVKYEFHPLCWSRGLLHPDPGFPICDRVSFQKLGGKPLQKGGKAAFSSSFPRLGIWLKPMVFNTQPIRAHACSPAVGLQVNRTSLSVYLTMSPSCLFPSSLLISTQTLDSDMTKHTFIRCLPSVVLITSNALYHVIFSTNP